MNIWTLDEEVFAICQKAEVCAVPFGFHVALGGSTLHSGKSAKDLDLIFYTHKHRESPDREALLNVLKACGFVNQRKMCDLDPKQYPGYRPVVACTYYGGKRIDFLFV